MFAICSFDFAVSSGDTVFDMLYGRLPRSKDSLAKNTCVTNNMVSDRDMPMQVTSTNSLMHGQRVKTVESRTTHSPIKSYHIAFVFDVIIKFATRHAITSIWVKLVSDFSLNHFGNIKGQKSLLNIKIENKLMQRRCDTFDNPISGVIMTKLLNVLVKLFLSFVRIWCLILQRVTTSYFIMNSFS